MGAPIPTKVLEGWAATVFVAAGLTADDAALAASMVVDADRRGLATHGVARIDVAVQRLRSGELNPRPNLVIEAGAGFIRADGDNGLGWVVGARTIDAALDRLAESPVQSFFLRRSGHMAELGAYVRRAAARGKVGLIAQVTQPIVAPQGSIGPAIGNNPIAFAAPVVGRPPLVFDTSCSKVARGNVLLAARTGAPIPADWAIGRDGLPTTDPAEALLGAMLPAGGHKGLGLAMLVQVLAASLTGADPIAGAGQSTGADVGAFGLVIDPGEVVGQDQFEQHMARWTQRYQDAVGPNGRLPGVRAASAQERADSDGIVLSDAIAEELARVGRSVGVPFPVFEQGPRR